MALTNKLSAIGDAIREKTGKTELLTLDAMPLEIASITTGGGGSEDCNGLHIPEEAFNWSGNLQYALSNKNMNWFFEEFGSKIKLNYITDLTNFAYGNTEIKTIPFNILGSANAPIGCNQMFANCYQLREAPQTFGIQPTGLWQAFASCLSLNRLPYDYFDKMDFSYLLYNGGEYDGDYSYIFSNCNSLRYVPGFKQEQINPRALYPIYSGGFCNCYVIDEIYLPVYTEAEYWDNTFWETFDNCHRLSGAYFNTDENGNPYVCPNWHYQTIDLSYNVGYTGGNDLNILNYSHIHGITEANKNKQDDNGWTDEVSRSRFNGGSALRLIETLPDCSAGSNNTVIFQSWAGSMTGYSTSDLTEEDIAVAVAKGWTVTFR